MENNKTEMVMSMPQNMTKLPYKAEGQITHHLSVVVI